MRVAICGASGFIGTNTSRNLVNNGYEVVRIGREHFKNSQFLSDSLNGCEVVINLCGAPIMKKWDEIYKHELYVSRVETTKKLIKEIDRLVKKPKLFISVSAVGIYKESLTHDDDSCDYDTNYLALLAKNWEEEAKKSKEMGVRSVIFRLGVVLGKNGGAIEEFKLAFKMGLGAIPGDGNQQFSWIHIDDVTSAFMTAIEKNSMSGIYNLVSPHGVTIKSFMQTFGKITGKKVWLHIPQKLLYYRYAEGAETLLRGAYIVPKRLLEEDFCFNYLHIDDALNEILLYDKTV